MPLIGAAQLLPIPEAAASILGYWFLVRMIQIPEEFDTTKIGLVQRLSMHVKAIWNALEPKIFTFKHHCFFEHSLGDFLELYGNPYQWSASPFEALHRHLQCHISQFTTMSEGVVVKRFLMMQRASTWLEHSIARSHNDNFVRLLRDLKNDPQRFWLSLGSNEYQRVEEWWRRFSVCSSWQAEARKAIAFALDDLRSYEMKDGILIPPKKKKTVRVDDMM
ncbi:hypothetical protein Aduo_017323 [Ancylostoma duodenale]